MDMIYTLKDNGECSQMFLDSVRGGGGRFVECHCGIDHYAVCDMDEEEEETLPDESDKVKHHWEESIHYFDLDNKIFVDDCDSCRKSLLKYELFIWGNRTLIRDYLKLRVDQELEWAQQEKTLNILAGI